MSKAIYNSRSICLIIILTLFCLQVFGQKRTNLKKVTIEELEMKSYPRDTTASAVILMDLGYFESNSVTFHRKLRVKILTKAGLQWGNWVINTPSKGDFKVTTHNLVSGKIQSEKANSDGIFSEEIIDDFAVYKVFAPNVTVGSVIDIYYSYIGIPTEWRFQERIPIAFSELLLEPTNLVSYNKTFFGFERIETITPYQWQAVNMPAFKEEPFLNTYSNYITKFQIQIESFGRPGTNTIDLSTSWKKVIDNLLANPRFGGVIKGSSFLNDFVKQIKLKNLSKNEKIQAAYEYIQRNIKWDGTNRLLASIEYRNNFLSDHDGSSADINLILVALLNKLEIDAYPVVLSTRSNGLLVPYSTTISKLNYVVAYIQDSDINMLIDATSPAITSPGILPFECLNGQGLLIKEDNEQWLSLNKDNAHIQRQFIKLVIDESGTVKGTITRDLYGYAFLEWFEDYKSNNSDNEAQKNSIRKRYSDIDILSYNAPIVDSKKMTVKEIIEIDMTDQLIDGGGVYILNPFVMFEYASNPFKSEERRYPVDLNYPRELSVTINVQIPRGYSYKDTPESKRFSNTDGSAMMTYLVSPSANAISYRIILKISRNEFTETEYQDLKGFFSEIVKKINTPIEISKT